MPTTIARFIALICLFGAQVAAAAPLLPPADASRMGSIHVAASCATACRQQHNQCRITTRGASRCDAQLQRCLQGCLGNKKQHQPQKKKR